MEVDTITCGRCIEAAIQGNLKEFDHLISSVSSLNIRNEHNKTILHFLCSFVPGSLPFIKHLVNKGADLNVLDGNHLTPIQVAAEHENASIVDYLALLDPVLIKFKISAFEILGAKIGTEEAVAIYWKKALQLRSQVTNEERSDVTKEKRSDATNEERSQVTNEEQDKHVAKMDSFKLFGIEEIKNFDDLNRIGSCLIRRGQYCFLYLCKNLGLDHRNSQLHFYLICQQYDQLAVSYQSPECEFITNGILNVLESKETIFLIAAKFSEILLRWIGVLVTKINREHDLTYTDIEKIFQLLVDQLEKIGKALKDERPNKDITYKPISDVRVVYSTMALCFALEKTLEEQQRFHQNVKRLIAIDQEYHSCFGTTILHESVPRTKMPSMVCATKIPACELVSFLLKLGVSVNLLNRNNETTLLKLLQQKYQTYRILGVIDKDQTWLDLVNVLLENGTDIDIRDRNGMTSLRLLHELGIPVCEVKYRTLQCLAASTIKRHQVDYSEKVPKQIETFINLH